MEEFHVSPADLDSMTMIVRATSYRDGKDRWTTLGIFYRTGYNRPYVGVVEGFERGESTNGINAKRFSFKFAALGTLDRVLRWFDDSELTDYMRLACEDWTPPVPPKPQPRGYDGPASLTCLLAWLYDFDLCNPSDNAVAKALERDFGVGSRTTRNMLRQERDTPGRRAPPSVWFPPFLAAMRQFDRWAWLETIANPSVDTPTTAATSPARSDKGNTDDAAQPA